jgi:hypothetical protein
MDSNVKGKPMEIKDVLVGPLRYNRVHPSARVVLGSVSGGFIAKDLVALIRPYRSSAGS